MRTANWMGRPELGLEHKTLNAIIMPGSHDAGLYLVSASGSLVTKALKPEVFITQNLNIWDQLRAGSRFFDLRVAECGTGILSSELRLVHAFEPPLMRGAGFFGKFGERIETVLYQVRQFMGSEEAKTGGVNKEVVILRFAHLTDSVRNKLISLIPSFLQYAQQETHGKSEIGQEQPTQYKAYMKRALRFCPFSLMPNFLRYAQREEYDKIGMGKEKPVKYIPGMRRDLRFCSPAPINLAQCPLRLLQGKVLVVIEGLIPSEEVSLASRGIFVYKRYTAGPPTVRTISQLGKQGFSRLGLHVCGHFSNTLAFEQLKTSQLKMLQQHTAEHPPDSDHLCQVYWTHTDNSLLSQGVRQNSVSILADLDQASTETAIDQLIRAGGGSPNIILLDFISPQRSEQVIKHNLPISPRRYEMPTTLV